MSKTGTLLMLTGILWFSIAKVEGTIIYDDGGIHEINTFINGGVEVYDSSTGNPTTVKLLSEGLIQWGLLAYNNSQVTISGGSMGYGLGAYDNSQVTIFDGTIGEDLAAENNSQITIFGGSIGEYLLAHNESRITISGGSIGEYMAAFDNSQVIMSGGSVVTELIVGNNSQITIYGTDFNVNGEPVGYGPITAASGILTGTLDSGEAINNDFYIYDDAGIALVPEPGTVLLLGLGGLFLLKKQ